MFENGSPEDKVGQEWDCLWNRDQLNGNGVLSLPVSDSLTMTTAVGVQNGAVSGIAQKQHSSAAGSCLSPGGIQLNCLSPATINNTLQCLRLSPAKNCSIQFGGGHINGEVASKDKGVDGVEPCASACLSVADSCLSPGGIQLNCLSPATVNNTLQCLHLSPAKNCSTQFGGGHINGEVASKDRGADGVGPGASACLPSDSLAGVKKQHVKRLLLPRTIQATGVKLDTGPRVGGSRKQNSKLHSKIPSLSSKKPSGGKSKASVRKGKVILNSVEADNQPVVNGVQHTDMMHGIVPLCNAEQAIEALEGAEQVREADQASCIAEVNPVQGPVLSCNSGLEEPVTKSSFDVPVSCGVTEDSLLNKTQTSPVEKDCLWELNRSNSLAVTHCQSPVLSCVNTGTEKPVSNAQPTGGCIGEELASKEKTVSSETSVGAEFYSGNYIERNVSEGVALQCISGVSDRQVGHRSQQCKRKSNNSGGKRKKKPRIHQTKKKKVPTATLR